MSSDHWNFLANLLGTPGAPEPPEDESKEAVEQQPDATSESTQSPPLPTVSTSPTDLASETTSDPTPESEHSAEDKVLDALKSAVPQELLPGFAAKQEDEAEAEAADSKRASAVTEFDDTPGNDEPATASGEDLGTESDSSDVDENAWGDLARELGVEPDKVPPPPRREISEQPTRPDRERSPRSKTKKPSGGFGKGLGMDLGPEPEAPDDAAVSTDAQGDLESSDVADSLFQREADRGRERAGERSQGGRSGRPRREEVDVAEDRESDRSRAGRSGRQRRDEPSERVSDDRGVADQRPGRDESEESSQRRRGRRGARQRITAEELERDERGVRSDDADAADQSRPRRGGRRGERRSESGTGRETPARKGWDDLDDELDSDLSSPSSPNEQEQEEEEAAGSRSRRRGRRGRGRGRKREQDESRRDVVAETDDDSVARESAFDDDYEDDIEVEAIRRSRRSRSRHRDRDDQDRDDTGREAGREKQRSRDLDEDDRPRSRRWRDSGQRDEESGEGNVRRRASVPTWIETVELLVNANLENHKKSKGGGRGRGPRRR